MRVPGRVNGHFEPVYGSGGGGGSVGDLAEGDADGEADRSLTRQSVDGFYRVAEIEETELELQVDGGLGFFIDEDYGKAQDAIQRVVAAYILFEQEAETDV